MANCIWSPICAFPVTLVAEPLTETVERPLLHLFHLSNSSITSSIIQPTSALCA
ncbi:MAG: hypothetical protein IH962_00905 [Chloroflexi bacterium]|nr:hypothetical protein [Chloroflexota bacterium]